MNTNSVRPAKIIGGCIIAITLFAAAYAHLVEPDSFVSFYTQQYKSLHDLAQINQLTVLPSPDKIAKYWLIIIKIVGAFQGAVGILVLFQDWLGYLLQFAMLTLVTLLTHCKNHEFSVLSSGNLQKIDPEIVWVPINLGIALALLGAQMSNKVANN